MLFCPAGVTRTIIDLSPHSPYPRLKDEHDLLGHKLLSVSSGVLFPNDFVLDRLNSLGEISLLGDFDGDDDLATSFRFYQLFVILCRYPHFSALPVPFFLPEIRWHFRRESKRSQKRG